MAKEKRTNTLQSRRQLIFDMFGDDSCCQNASVNVEEIDMAINDCQAMLYYAIDRNDKEEISYWRKMLQENKVQRRELLSA